MQRRAVACGGARHETSVLFNEAESGARIGAQHAARRVLIHGRRSIVSPLRTHRGPVSHRRAVPSHFPYLWLRTRLSAIAPRVQAAWRGCISRRHVVPFSRMVPLNLHLSRVATVNAYALVAVSSFVASCLTERERALSLLPCNKSSAYLLGGEAAESTSRTRRNENAPDSRTNGKPVVPIFRSLIFFRGRNEPLGLPTIFNVAFHPPLLKYKQNFSFPSFSTRERNVTRSAFIRSSNANELPRIT